MKQHLKDYFIPHEGNEYKPHSLQKAAMVGMVGMVLLSFTLANLQSLIWLSSDWLVSAILPAVIVDLTNEERADEALGSLRRSSVLDAAARLKAQDMARYSYFAHTSPRGVTPWYWFGQVDYNFVHAGENLAVHFVDSGDVVDAWMDSPTHRDNIMNGNYTEIGIGTAEGEYEGFSTVYVVQLFGTPARSTASAIVPEPELEPEPVVAGVVEPEPLIETEPEPVETDVVLAENAEITETVEFIPAEPELVTLEELVMLAEPTKATTSETEIVEIEATEDSVALYSDFVSTSTGGIPATIDPQQGEAQPGSTWYARLLTQPHIVLQVLYSVITLFVLIVLILAIFIEIRRQQPVQIAYAAALLVLMYGLFELHTHLGGALIV